MGRVTLCNSLFIPCIVCGRKAGDGLGLLEQALIRISSFWRTTSCASVSFSTRSQLFHPKLLLWTTSHRLPCLGRDLLRSPHPITQPCKSQLMYPLLGSLSQLGSDFPEPGSALCTSQQPWTLQTRLWSLTCFFFFFFLLFNSCNKHPCALNCQRNDLKGKRHWPVLSHVVIWRGPEITFTRTED